MTTPTCRGMDETFVFRFFNLRTFNSQVIYIHKPSPKVIVYYYRSIFHNCNTRMFAKINILLLEQFFDFFKLVGSCGFYFQSPRRIATVDVPYSITIDFTQIFIKQTVLKHPCLYQRFYLWLGDCCNILNFAVTSTHTTKNP